MSLQTKRNVNEVLRSGSLLRRFLLSTFHTVCLHSLCRLTSTSLVALMIPEYLMPQLSLAHLCPIYIQHWSRALRAASPLSWRRGVSPEQKSHILAYLRSRKHQTTSVEAQYRNCPNLIPSTLHASHSGLTPACCTALQEQRSRFQDKVEIRIVNLSCGCCSPPSLLIDTVPT